VPLFLPTDEHHRRPFSEHGFESPTGNVETYFDVLLVGDTRLAA
jgi:hypothetical protein